MYQEFTEGLADADSLHAVSQICKQISHHYGFYHYLYGVEIPVSLGSQQYFVLDSRQLSQHPTKTPGFFTSTNPLIKSCSSLNEKMAAEYVNISQEVYSAAFCMGITDGISLPIHSQSGGSAVFNVIHKRTFDDPPQEPIKDLPELYLLAVHIHQAIKRFLKVENNQAAATKVTKREKECLLFSAQGLKTTAIAYELAISESTVTFHFKNAMIKLSARNRQQAVARAITLGVIAL
jgi:DNA-binding CsgD family transcriptional regulator